MVWFLSRCKIDFIISSVFNQNNLMKLVGHWGIGHVRYPTAGTPDKNEAQPFYTNYPYDYSPNSLFVATESLLPTTEI